MDRDGGPASWIRYRLRLRFPGKVFQISFSTATASSFPGFRGSFRPSAAGTASGFLGFRRFLGLATFRRPSGILPGLAESVPLPASRESVSNIIQHGDGFQLPAAARRRPGFLDPSPAPAPASRRRPRNGSGWPADPARKRRIFSEGVLYNIYNYQIAWIYRPFSGPFSGFQATAPAPAPADGSGPGFRPRLQFPRKPFPPVKTARRKFFCRGKCSKIRASSASGQVFCRLAEKKLLTGTNPGVIIPTEPGNKPRNRTTKRREQEQ